MMVRIVIPLPSDYAEGQALSHLPRARSQGKQVFQPGLCAQLTLHHTHLKSTGIYQELTVRNALQ